MRLLTFEYRPGDATGGRQAPHDLLTRVSEGLDSLHGHGAGTLRLGAVIARGASSGAVVDLNRAFAVRLALDDVGAPEAEADSILPADMLRFLARGESALAAARETLAFVEAHLGRFDGPDLTRLGAVVARDEAVPRAPIARPGKILGVARNYRAHAEERGGEAPSEPVFFVKASSCVIGTGEEIQLPAASRQVDYEGELAVVIGRPTREVAAEDALEAVGGYTVANDVTARDFQNVRGQHFLGKSCDTFAPMGPVLVTPDEIFDPQALDLSTTLSGEVRQKASTGAMIFRVAELIAFASRLMTLEPGDVILTGTPAGVGADADPPRFLRDGDVLDTEIGGIGRLRNYVRC